MKIIVTDYFDKILKKECGDLNIEILLNKVKIESKNFIAFKNPFFKVKINSKTKTYRLILIYEKEYLKMVFINIFDKKDKQFGENINWDLHKNLILKFYELNLNDLENGKFRIYEI